MASTTISVEGDLTYRDALTILAKLRKTTVAKITRAALNSSEFNEELQGIDEYIRVQSGTRKRQRSSGTQKAQTE